MDKQTVEALIYLPIVFLLVYFDIVIAYLWKVVITKRQTTREFFTGRK